MKCQVSVGGAGWLSNGAAVICVTEAYCRDVRVSVERLMSFIEQMRGPYDAYTFLCVKEENTKICT
jgi:hypothetical protein